MVRLRRLLGTELLGSRPYRLQTPISADVTDVDRYLERSAVHAALRHYRGPLLPQSTAPGIERLRWSIEQDVRAAVLTATDPRHLLWWTGTAWGREDLEAWERLAVAAPAGATRERARSHARRLAAEFGLPAAAALASGTQRARNLGRRTLAATGANQAPSLRGAADAADEPRARRPRPAHRTADRAGPRGAVTPRPPARVVIVDDHVLLRQGLRALLQTEPSVVVLGEAGTTADALTAVARCRPDVVILDVRLVNGVLRGVELCRRLITAHPTTRVVVLTTELTESVLLSALRAGASGVLLKDNDFAALVRAIQDVRAGRNAFDSRTAALAARLVRRSGGGDVPRLTEREVDILGLMARGLSNRTISGRLFISETTVKFHVANVLRKMTAATRGEAVFRAGELGLI